MNTRTGRPILDTLNQIDIRWLAKNCKLESGRGYRLTWNTSRGGELLLEARMLCGRIAFCKVGGAPARDISGARVVFSAVLSWSRCNFGGARPWFVCPHENCGRRVAILYLGHVIGCRHCVNGVYASSGESRYDRSVRKLTKFEHRWGLDSTRVGVEVPKPKGTHYRIYSHRLDELECRKQACLSLWLGAYQRVSSKKGSAR